MNREAYPSIISSLQFPDFNKGANLWFDTCQMNTKRPMPRLDLRIGL